MSSDIEILDVIDEASFGLLPPCADPRFDHRSCDYWEDEVNGAKTARPAWWERRPSYRSPAPRPRSDNPFAPDPSRLDEFNPFAPAGGEAAEPLDGDDPETHAEFNPFAPAPTGTSRDVASDDPRKLRSLRRGLTVFGSYAKVLLSSGVPAGYAQFGPLSAYPRAQHIRELYPDLPQSPLPAVITCVATTPPVREQGLARALIRAVTADLSGRGFAAVEAYPDLTLAPDEASAASPAFWLGCGFELAVDDERYPVMRRELS